MTCRPRLEQVEIAPIPQAHLPSQRIWTLHCPHLSASGDPTVLAEVAEDHTRRTQGDKR